MVNYILLTMTESLIELSLFRNNELVSSFFKNIKNMFCKNKIFNKKTNCFAKPTNNNFPKIKIINHFDKNKLSTSRPSSRVGGFVSSKSRSWNWHF